MSINFVVVIMENSGAQSSEDPAPPPPPAEELLKKIEELEIGHAHLKQEVSKLVNLSTPTAPGASDHRPRQRSQSVSPQRASRRRAGGGDGSATVVWRRGLAPFQHSSPLQRESNSREMDHGSDGEGPAAVKFTDRQYLNILQSMGQSVHICDLDYQIIYWWVN